MVLNSNYFNVSFVKALQRHGYLNGKITENILTSHFNFKLIYYYY